MYYSKSTNGFYTREIHGAKMPEDTVEITAEQHSNLIEGQSNGKVITSDTNGRPILQDPPAPAPLTRDQIESLRLKAYADPITGSDRYFAEASRLQAGGAAQAEIGAANAAGANRYAETQNAYPWPA